MNGPGERDLLHWSESLAAVARTGLAFTESLYERERFEEILRIAADMRSRAADTPAAAELVEEWMRSSGQGAAGYATPKLAVGALVANDDDELLLIRRADSGMWLYPTGWADVGWSAAEVVVREVHEETGITCEPLRLVALVDGLRAGFTRIPLHSMIFHCRATGGELRGHPLEVTGLGWFGRDALPEPLAGSGAWVDMAFDALTDRAAPARFDPPRPRDEGSPLDGAATPGGAASE